MPNITQSIKDHITITCYAEQVGLHPVVRSIAQNSFKLEEHDSCVISYDKNGQQRFFWNSRQCHGSVIDFCMEVNGIPQEQAIRELRDLLGTRTASQWDTLRQYKKEENAARASPKEYTLPKPSKIGQRRMFAYLIKTRGLSQALVTALVKDKLLYQDERGNAVFVGRDYDGKDKYAFYRSTLSDVVYRGEAIGSKKEVNFSINLIGKQPDRLFVCEAAIDALSVASMLEYYGAQSDQYAYLSLGSTHSAPLLYHLKHHPQLQKIYLCQDRDEAGEKSKVAMRIALKEAGFQGEIIEKAPVHKDSNQDLLALRAAQKSPKAPAMEPPVQHAL